MNETDSTRYGPGSPEAEAAAALAEHLGTALRPRRLTLPDGTAVEVEAMDAEGTVVAQFVLNGGAVKSTLRNKVAADLFKLVWVRQALVPDARAVLCVSPTVATLLARRGWLAAAARDLRIAVLVVQGPGRVEPLTESSAA
ncbi:hypothetical protein ITJ64_12430 [Herbiconiux sp. VKM Ac-1786]|jgi:hypothetical protein|uniref:hypothetical protein n=1 Tax=Herbiconiux sp. VKM Ac-1786 TaxID=2783824 RepID=UPI00188D5D54|nr:hypothetical protein [Herbiconiux sp. VKM Ac-1786]MBF4573324.1 hypothetical protein [Herbiconiux sp. VKM Ac-1786]